MRKAKIIIEVALAVIVAAAIVWAYYPKKHTFHTVPMAELGRQVTFYCNPDLGCFRASGQ